MTIRLNDPHAIKLIMEAAHVQFVPQLHFCIADYDRNDCLRGGVLFTDFWGGSIAIHMAGFKPNWVSKAMVYLAFDYPFRHLRVKKLFGLVPEWNVKSRNATLHLGFKIEYLVADVYNLENEPNGMYIMSMKREDCRWLNMPPPRLELVQPQQTDTINLPLASLPTVGMMQ